MRLLHKIKDCVLWLLQSNKWSEINLKREALDRGVDPARLIFMRSCEYSEYLSRLTVVDLYLDTFTFNAGAIANDSLWCGLPVLTRQGQSYVARRASSLLAAVDLPECIATNEDGYEIRAHELASNTKNSIQSRPAWQLIKIKRLYLTQTDLIGISKVRTRKYMQNTSLVKNQSLCAWKNIRPINYIPQ